MGATLSRGGCLLSTLLPPLEAAIPGSLGGWQEPLTWPVSLHLDQVTQAPRG